MPKKSSLPTRSVFTYPARTDHVGRETPLEQKEAYELAAEWIRDADKILFCSGAGMGVDSGLPDFRGKEGFWNAYPPMKNLGLEFAEMSSPRWFAKDPTFAWGFWAHRSELYRTKQYHEGYTILHKWGQQKQALPQNSNEMGYFSLTSNVDGHWQRLLPADRLYEIHGTVTHWQCVNDCKDKIWDAPEELIKYSHETFRIEEKHLPTCPDCNRLARPNVLMFGDWGWNHKRTSDQEVNYTHFEAEVGPDNRLVVVEIGAGLGVPTVRLSSERIANEKQGKLIRINIRDPQANTLSSSYVRTGSGIVRPPNVLSLPYGGLGALQTIDQLLSSPEK